MRKKLLSYVLAVVLTAGFAAAGFAIEEGAPSQLGGSYGPGGVMNEAQGVVIKPADANPDVNKVVGRITQVFNYQSGILVSTMDADRNVTVFDAGRVRATMGYNSNGTYTVTSVNFFGTDMGRINAMPGSGGEKLKNFMLAMNVAPSQLMSEVQKYDGDKLIQQDPDNYNPTYADVVWFQAAFDALSKGVNHSISVDLVASGGAQVTVNENGKPQVTYAASGDGAGKPVAIKEYAYKNGFLTQIRSLTYEVAELPESVLNKLDEDQQKIYKEAMALIKQRDSGAKLTEAETKKIEEMSKLAQTNGEVKMKPGSRTTYMDAYGRASYDADGHGNVLATYTYGSNGSLNYVSDTTTKAKTYYVNGQPSFVVNDKGFITDKYVRHPNGTLNGVETYNNGAIKEMTAYSYGKAVATADLTSGRPATYDSIRAAVKDITSPGKTVEQIQKIIEANNLKSIELYAEHLSNTNLMTALSLNAEAEKKKLEDKLKADWPNGIPSAVQSALDAWTNAKNATEAEKDKLWNAVVSAMSSNSSKMGGDLARIWANTNNGKDLNNSDIQARTEDYHTYLDLVTKKNNGTITPAESDKILALENKHNFSMKEETKDGKKVYTATQDWTAINNSQLFSKINEASTLTPAAIDKQVGDVRKAFVTMSMRNNGYSSVASVGISIDTTEETIPYDQKISRSSQNTGVVDRTRDHDTEGWVQRNNTTTTTEIYHKVTTKTMSFNITVNNNGAPAFAITGSAVLEKKTEEIKNVSTVVTQDYYDPAVIGTVERYVTVDADGNVIELDADAAKALIEAGGEVYVGVNAQEVNMMDGAGFKDLVKAEEGEEIFVKVTDSAMLDQMTKGEQVMVMGDVARSAGGHLTMTINTNYTTSYGNGLVTGSDIGKAKQEVLDMANDPDSWVAKNTKMNRAIFAAAGIVDTNTGYLNDWKEGWKTLAKPLARVITSVYNFANGF